MKYYIKKYEEPYEPLNKNYPDEVREHWWQGDDKKFREAVRNYDNYYGTILPEAEITSSKTTPTKTSNWTSEHNVAEDNKKYEQAHQAESLKIASAVSNKMNEVGNAIGTTALIGGMTIPALVASPIAFAGGMVGGLLGAKATDKVVDWSTDGKHKTWADWLVDKADTKYINNNIAEILNPGALVGGTIGGIFAKPAASWAYRNGKYAYNTKFKGVAKGGDMSEYVPQTIKNQVEAGIEGTKNLLKELGVTDFPTSSFAESAPYTARILPISKLTKAERLGIPKGGKVPYTTEENLAFRNQINEFAKKYGYNTIGDEVTDPEVLEKYARALIKLHNTFYRGISYAPDEATLMKWASKPRPNAEMYITPYSDVAKGYGDPVELLRPYKLGSDRTQWFTEGDFDIIPSAGDRISQGYSGKSGIYAPWVSRRPVLTSQGMVVPKPKSPESELVVINTNLIPKRVIYKMPVFSSYIKPNGDYRFSPWWKVGEMSPTGSRNLPNMHAEFKKGGSIHIKEKIKVSSQNQ